MARTVADAVAVLDVISGPDDADPVTASSADRKAASYAAALVEGSLSGSRIGVARQVSDRENADEEVLVAFTEALDAMRAQGATIIDPIEIRELDEIPRGAYWCPRFKTDLEAYLESLGPGAPFQTLQQIIDSGGFHPSVGSRLQFFQGIEKPPEENERCISSLENHERLRQGVRRVLAENQLDAIVYPTWSNPPRLIGDLNSPAGDNSQILSPQTGFPAVTVPMGFVRGGLPVGLQFFGEAWTEETLIRLAYSYEQATKHRVPPGSAPALGK